MVGEYIYAKIPLINNLLGCAHLDEFKACLLPGYISMSQNSKWKKYF